jgi:Tfp pilus assembly protein PilF
MGKFLDKHDGPLNQAMRELEKALEEQTPGQRARLWGNICDAAAGSEAGQRATKGFGRRAAMSRGYRRYRR